MNAKNLLTFQAIIALIFGLSFVFIPYMALEPYAVTEDQMTPTVIHLARLFGALLLAFAIGCWLQRAHTNHTHWMYMILIVNIINSIINITATTEGLLSSFNWGSVVLVVILAGWAAYVLFTEKSTS